MGFASCAGASSVAKETTSTEQEAEARASLCIHGDAAVLADEGAWPKRMGPPQLTFSRGDMS